MNHTKIEWVRNPDGTPGYTFNPITGCLNHVNGLCKGGGFPCYAYRLAHGRLKNLYLANKNWDTKTPQGYDGYPNLDPFYPRFWPERIPEDKFHYFGNIARVKPKGIFVCDMGELFGDWVPQEWQEQIFRVITLNPWHRFYLLTKQPQNLIKFSPFPDNCWVGVTATNYKMANEARYWLGKIEAKVKYLSLEPFLEPLRDRLDCLFQFDFQLDWLIIGAQTKPTVYPKIEWVQEIVEAADKAGMPVFLKDNLAPMLPNARIGLPFFYKPKRIEDTDQEFQWLLRQEMPGEGKRRSHGKNHD